jgi:hypothetical protein
MALWGKAHASATNKPKFLPTSEDSKYTRADAYATNSGWVMQSGHPSSGNGNAAADPEVLIAIKGLAGTSATTGLKTATVTAMRFVVGTTDTTDLTASNSAGRIRVEITWDEGVTVAGTPQVVIANSNASGGGYGNYTLSYISSGSTANRKLFEATSQNLGNTDVLTLGGTNIALNSGTIVDTASSSVASSLVLSGISAVAVTISS